MLLLWISSIFVRLEFHLFKYLAPCNSWSTTISIRGARIYWSSHCHTFQTVPVHCTYHRAKYRLRCAVGEWNSITMIQPMLIYVLPQCGSAEKCRHMNTYKWRGQEYSPLGRLGRNNTRLTSTSSVTWLGLSRFFFPVLFSGICRHRRRRGYTYQMMKGLIFMCLDAS